MADESPDRFAEPTDDDLARVATILGKIGGPHVGWGAQQSLDVLLVERQLAAERLASDRLTRATWVLAASTVALVLATIALVVVTVTA
ncbi:MAG: hypothetical protein JWL79_2924 [Frankiales bacterium]|nr:hypothetical protein [Frankiales bacterium]